MERIPILLVDDEEDIRDVLAMTLTDLGYAVTTAVDGAQALTQFQSQPTPIVLTDIKMPGMDGLELLQRIKRINPDAEVVMITGHGDMELAIKSLKFEATDFITKPINTEALEVALHRVSDRLRMKRLLQDYTEHLEALLKEKTELQDHLATLGLMIGSISHGIKGMLTGLDGAMYLLDAGFTRDKPEQVEEGWHMLKQMVQRLRKMVLDLLFCARKREMEPATVSIREFAEDLARTFTSQIKTPGIHATADVEVGDGSMEIDPDALQTALINLLDNAVDACVRDTTKTDHDIRFRVGEKHDAVLFEITDDGIGMDREVRERLFTLFFSSKGKKGTGLGLFITQKIIQQHQGDIEVRSSPGQGASFRVRIPKKAAAPSR